MSKSGLLFTTLALSLLAAPVWAQTAAQPASITNLAPSPTAPVSLVPPAPAVQVAQPTQQIPATAPIPTTVTTAPATISAPTPVPVAANTVAVPVVNSAPPAPAQLVPVAEKPAVEVATLEQVDPDAVGLLTNSNGGLGSGLWQNTNRAVVERLLPEISLPASSPTLNDLARRLLLSIAATPKGETTVNRSLLALRVEKLLALGANSEAWQLAQLNKLDRLDDITLQQVIAVNLIDGNNKKLCEQVPAMMVGHTSAEWQKLLILCQLRNGDQKGAQLGLDLMREQQVKDDIFIGLVNKNILGNSKALPRQLTPLRPLNLALLRQIDAPLPTELYARPDASLIPQLLQAKAVDEQVRLGLAEKAAARGTLSTTELAAIYNSLTFTADEKNNVAISKETGGRLHALYYQALTAQTDSEKRIDLAVRFLASLDAAALAGNLPPLIAESVKDIPAKSDYNRFAGQMLRLMVLGGKTDAALTWYKLALTVAVNLPDVASQILNLWPLLTLSNLNSDSDYAKELKPWLDVMLKDSDRTKRQLAGQYLLLFDAAGYAVPEEAWSRVIDVGSDSKKLAQPSPLLLQRLDLAGATNRRGESILLSLLLANGNSGETSFYAMVESIRALRLIGLSVEAAALARETALTLMVP